VLVTKCCLPMTFRGRSIIAAPCFNIAALVLAENITNENTGDNVATMIDLRLGHDLGGTGMLGLVASSNTKGMVVFLPIPPFAATQVCSGVGRRVEEGPMGEGFSYGPISQVPLDIPHSSIPARQQQSGRKQEPFNHTSAAWAPVPS